MKEPRAKKPRYLNESGQMEFYRDGNGFRFFRWVQPSFPLQKT
jgi:hypothetical protein